MGACGSGQRGPSGRPSGRPSGFWMPALVARHEGHTEAAEAAVGVEKSGSIFLTLT
jgi:hypothetical protein